MVNFCPFDNNSPGLAIGAVLEAQPDSLFLMLEASSPLNPVGRTVAPLGQRISAPNLPASEPIL
jgi:hypothetical protein